MVIVLVCQMWYQHLFYEHDKRQSFMALHDFFRIYTQAQVIIEIFMIVWPNRNVAPDLIC